MKYRIEKLIDNNSPHIETIVSWMMEWWGHEAGFSYEKMRAYMKHSLNIDRLPQTYIVLKDNELVGSYQFSMSDLDVRPDIYPWLINVYVDKDSRGKGIMDLIMKSVEAEGRNLKFKDLHLFTSHEGLYEKYNWNYIESFDSFIESKRIQRLYRMKLLGE